MNLFILFIASIFSFSFSFFFFPADGILLNEVNHLLKEKKCDYTVKWDKLVKWTISIIIYCCKFISHASCKNAEQKLINVCDGAGESKPSIQYHCDALAKSPVSKIFILEGTGIPIWFKLSCKMITRIQCHCSLLKNPSEERKSSKLLIDIDNTLTRLKY